MMTDHHTNCSSKSVPPKRVLTVIAILYMKRRLHHDKKIHMKWLHCQHFYKDTSSPILSIFISLLTTPIPSFSLKPFL